MKTRILTALAIILAVAYPVLAGGWALNLLGVFLVAACSYEWLHLLKGFSTWGKFVTPIMIVWILMFEFIPTAFVFGWLLIGAVIFWSLPVFCASMSQQTGSSVLMSAMILGLCYNCMLMLLSGQYQYLWTLVLATYGSDSGAYFAGRFFGRHKMIPRVSPKKTWEGFFGGWIAGFLLAFLFSFLYAGTLNWTINFGLCLLAPILAELGDLCFSSFKRSVQAKDFSNLLPGHGGILDRVDSLLMNFLLFGILSAIVSVF